MNEYDDMLASDAKANEYDAMIALDQDQGRQRLRASMFAAQRQNPDQYGEAKQIAQKTGIPAQVVARNLPEVKQRVQLNEYDKLLQTSPKLAEHLQNPDFASVAHDDIGNLAAIEAAVGPSFRALPDRQPTIRDRLINWWAGIVGGPTVEEQRQQQGAAEATAILAARKADSSLVPPDNANPAQIQELNNRAWEQSRQAVGGMSQVPLVAAERFTKAATFGIASPATPTETHSWQSSVAGGLGTLAGFIVGPAKAAAAGLAKLPGAALLNPAAGEAYITALAKTVVQHAATLGTASAMEEAGSAALDSHSVGEGVNRVARAAKSGAETGAIFGAASRLLPDSTLPQWVLRTLGVSMAQDATNNETPWDNRPLEDKIFSYGMNALFSAHGAGHTGGNWFTDNPIVRAGFANAERAKAAQEGFAKLQTLTDLATASPVRTRDPKAFRQFVETAAADWPVQDVYIDGRALTGVLNQSGVTPEVLAAYLPDAAAQIHEATQTQGDVRIPVGDYLTHIAGSELDKSLLPHLKTDPEGMTNQQSRAFFQSLPDTLNEHAAKIVDAKQAEDVHQAERQAVYDHVLGQLADTKRFPDAVNKAYASLVRDFYATTADRFGTTPDALMQKYPLQVKAERLAGVDRFDQSLNGAADNPRGAYSPDSKTVALFKNADLSTFLHESGHFFLDMTQDLAAHPEAPGAIKQDMGTLLKWFGVKDLDTWRAMSIDEQRASHEQFARGFEKYLLEGEAPSVELAGLFARFRAWIMNVYKSFNDLHVDLTPEVRGVMDRMLASDEAIRQAEQVRGYQPLFKSAADASMTPEEFSAYQQLGADATAEATTDMERRSLRDMQWLSNAKSKALKALQKEADGLRKAIRERVTEEVMSEPVNQARRLLKTGKRFDAEGNEIPDSRPLGAPKIKLDTAALREMYPEGSLGRPNLDKLRGMTAKEGMHPDLVADMVGISDGHELIRQLTEGENPKDKIAGLTDQHMLEEHGDLVDQASIERAAEAAIHNEVRARFVATEFKALSKSLGPARQLAAAAKLAAESAIAKRRIRDLHPAQHQAAEARAARNADKALAAGDLQAATVAKRAQLLNNRLTKAAVDAVEEVRKGVDYLKKFSKPSVRENIELEYRDQIDALLDRHDLRKSTTNADLDKREALSAFVERMAATGYEPQIPEKLLNEAARTHYKDMPVNDFRGLVDAVKSIEHLGRLKTRLLDLKEMRDLKELADEAQAVTSQLPQRAAETNRGLTKMQAKWLGAKSAGRSMQGALLKMEQMFDWLDNRNPNGVFNRVVFRRIADAGVKEADLQARVKAEIDKLMDSHLTDVTKDGGKIYTADGLIDGLTGKPQRFTKKEMLALAGNMGNESNVAKLTAGEKWDEAEVWAFLHRNMSKADWDFVAGLGKTLEILWPEKLAMSRRLGNTNPEKIEPRAFDTPHGRYDGWYWPMVYDPARAQDVAERGARAGDALFENIYTRANTDTGRMLTRNVNYARSLLLSLDVIPRVIKDEIHDIAYREAIIDADKFLSSAPVRDAIQGALSPEHYDQLRPWLQSIANDRKVDMQALKWYDRLAHGARTRATIVGLGYRLTTFFVHTGSAGMESVAELGPKWMAAGLADFANPLQWKANRDFVFERSGEMRNRMNEVDRDVREHLREIDLRLMDTTTGAIERGIDVLKAHAYQAIAMGDMASALPTWMGAYHKAMAPEAKGGLGMGEQDAVYFAEKTVRNAHGGTGVKDLAAVQRGPEFFKLFTMFYTFWNHNVNRLMDTARLAKSLPETYRTGEPGEFRGDLGTVIMRTLIYTLGVQAMHSMLHPKKDSEGDTHWFMWAAKELTASAFAGIPVFRDISAHYLTGRDYSTTPAAGMVQAIGNSGIDAMHAMTGQEVSDKWLKHTITTAGYVFGLPLGQPASTIQFLWDVAAGEQDPHSAADWWNGILHGESEHR